MLSFRRAEPTDRDAIWSILKTVIAGGDVYAFLPNSDKDELMDYWLANDKYTYVAVLDGEIVGSFYMRTNQPGLGSHIVNAGYMTSPDHSGKGIGYEMGAFSLKEAKRLGYKAMQFNLVVKTNEVAVRLWQRLGFTIIGEIPEAFQHQTLGLVNAYVMYQKLT